MLDGVVPDAGTTVSHEALEEAAQLIAPPMLVTDTVWAAGMAVLDL